MWEQFITTKDFKDIHTYIAKEYEVFKVYFDSMYEKIMQNPKLQNPKLIDEKVLLAVNNNHKQVHQVIQNIIFIEHRLGFEKGIEGVRHRVLQYDWETVSQGLGNSQEFTKPQLIHLDRILDCIFLDETFQFENMQYQQFNFKQYYEEDTKLDAESLCKKILAKLEKLK